MTGPVCIRDVALRDGLQLEAPVALERRLAIAEALLAAGVRHLEAGAFVSPRAVPQMADSEAFFVLLPRQPGVTYSAIVVNERGLQRAEQSGVDEVHYVVSASDTHSRVNIRRSTAAAVVELCRAVQSTELPVEVVVATAFGCPYEGEVDTRSVVEIVDAALEAGAIGVSLADTTGMATPRLVRWLIDVVEPRMVGRRLAVHFHNTRGIGLANVMAAYEHGVRSFDASVGGLGGCPFAPGASGNVPTEEVALLLDDLGADTGVDIDALLGVSALVEETVGHPVDSQVARAGPRLRRYPAPDDIVVAVAP